MKKIYLAILALGLFNISRAQTLTAASEGSVGDVHSYKLYDSIAGGIPKTTGAGQSWNFSACSQNTAPVTVKNYSTPGSIPQSTMFPGCTIVETEASSDNLFWKSVASPTAQYELLGINNPGANSTITFTNSLIVAQWPVTMGYNQTDVAAGTATLGASGTSNMTMTSMGSGTGTITLPGGAVMASVLQVKTTNTLVLNLTGAATVTIKGTDYDYYHSSQKFALLTVSYETQTIVPVIGPNTITATAKIKVNSNVITGINEKNFDATFSIFPNPAKDAFNVDLSNANNNNGVIEIYNTAGALVKTVDLGNAGIIRQNVSISGLSSGIYIVKTTLGSRTSSRKLIVE